MLQYLHTFKSKTQGGGVLIGGAAFAKKIN